MDVTRIIIAVQFKHRPIHGQARAWFKFGLLAIGGLVASAAHAQSQNTAADTVGSVVAAAPTVPAAPAAAGNQSPQNLPKDADGKSPQNAAERLQNAAERLRDSIERHERHQIVRVERPMRVERPERVVRPEKIERPEKPHRPGR